MTKQYAVKGYTSEGTVIPQVWSTDYMAKVLQADRIWHRGGFHIRVISKDGEGVIRGEYEPTDGKD